VAARVRVICASAELLEGGAGVRFEVDWITGPEPAFVVRYRGQPRAFLNRCAHVPTQLDWVDGAFFDTEGHYIICGTHGALYEPTTGRCVLGPCRGRSLTALQVVEQDGQVLLVLPERR
jgi:nitrite reductase/ring-hydroxylating ferredoxin subunit